ncbi:MAG: collagen-like protein [Bacteroidales bacterium]|nr:collagen-like protein [Bacteroidales bacterium]
MRKLSLILLAALTLAASCQKIGPMGPMGPQGPQGPKGDPSNINIVIINVPQEAWEYSYYADNNYFVATIDVPELTEDAFDYGFINCYRTYDYDTMLASQVALPYVRLLEEVDGDNVYFYTETIDYEYGIGWVKIYYTLSDFFYEVDETLMPDAMQFRLAIAY